MNNKWDELNSVHIGSAFRYKILIFIQFDNAHIHFLKKSSCGHKW